MQIVSNFNMSANKFLDSRKSWASLADLKANKDILMPNGFLAYCKNEDKWYKMNCTDESNPTTYTWSEFNNLGDVEVDLTGLFMTSSEITAMLDDIFSGTSTSIYTAIDSDGYTLVDSDGYKIIIA